MSLLQNRPLAAVDLRSESTFRKSIAPGNGRLLPTSYLILRDQILYPFAQGFLWAVAKDWYQVSALFVRLHGRSVGNIVHSWLVVNWQGWTSAGVKVHPA